MKRNYLKKIADAIQRHKNHLNPYNENIYKYMG